MKFSTALVAAAVATTAVHAQDQSSCVQLDYTQKAKDFNSLNGVIDLAVNTGLIGTFTKPYDPLAVAGETLDVIPVSILGHDFEVTPTIKAANFTGVSTVHPHHLNVTGPTNVNLGVDFTGTLAFDGTFSLSIKQVNKQWWQLCYTDLLHPAECKPKTTEIEVGLSVTKPQAVVDINYAMMTCPTPAGTCKPLAVADILTAALTKKFDVLLKRILLRSKSLELTKIDLDFEKINEIHFHFLKSGPLLTAIGQKLFDFTEDALNKKGPVSKIAIDVTEKLGKSLVNNLVKGALAPQFGSGCFDA
ncbi:hypothetical protein Poli38472_014160 [Pythium oligandrum]|uniref:Uncharacterized protein n=1 Tax=Pythium oligandrum TaxID=41045 RepID=A0A8K1CKH9_PYTOL|nr:hypothetical protein Poli38472_014160 [Pythium oligandrum]|eukprot:TMW64043.1 hypothetical protein Poli38472_014160 [Pythium oligandrum]